MLRERKIWYYKLASVFIIFISLRLSIGEQALRIFSRREELFGKRGELNIRSQSMKNMTTRDWSVEVRLVIASLTRKETIALVPTLLASMANISRHPVIPDRQDNPLRNSFSTHLLCN